MAETSGMIERVARGLARLRVEQNMRYPDFAKETMTPERIEAAVDHGWPNFTAEAEAAIRAMREPTEAMRYAVWYDQYITNGGSPAEAATLAQKRVDDPKQREQDMSSFSALIDAALPSPAEPR